MKPNDLEDSALVDSRLRALVGVETAAYHLDIEKSDVIRFAQAVEYDAPWFVDEHAARSSGYGGVIVSPTYLIVMRGMEHEALIDIGVDMLHRQGVDGGSVWEYLAPIRVGDRISARAMMSSLEVKTTSFGETLFQTIDITYRNQFGDTVVKQTDTRIYY